MRKHFEIQIQLYGSSRYNIEKKVIKCESSINVLEAVSTLEGAMENALTPMLAKAKNDIKEGFKLAVETARAFNNACLWSMKDPLPHPKHAGD